MLKAIAPSLSPAPPSTVTGQLRRVFEATPIPNGYFDPGVWSDFARLVSDQVAEKLPNLRPEVDQVLATYGGRQHEVQSPTNVEPPSRLSRVKTRLEKQIQFWKFFAEKKAFTVDVSDGSALLAAVHSLPSNLGRALRIWIDAGGREAEIKEGYVTLRYKTPQKTIGVYKLRAGLLVPSLPVGFHGTLVVDPEIVRKRAARCSYIVQPDVKGAGSVNLAPNKDRALRWRLVRQLFRAFKGRHSRQELRRRLRDGGEPSLSLLDARSRTYRVSLTAGKIPLAVAQRYRERLATARRRAERLDLYKHEMEAMAVRLAMAVAGQEFLQKESVAREVIRRESAFQEARSRFWEHCQRAMDPKYIPVQGFVVPPWPDHVPSWVLKRNGASAERAIRLSLGWFNDAYERLRAAYSQFEEVFGTAWVSEVREECDCATQARPAGRRAE